MGDRLTIDNFVSHWERQSSLVVLVFTTVKTEHRGVIPRLADKTFSVYHSRPTVGHGSPWMHLKTSQVNQ